jgi:TrwC relaxase
MAATTTLGPLFDEDGERLGYGVTFVAPRSVTLASREDERISQAHQDAVNAALEMAKRQMSGLEFAAAWEKNSPHLSSEVAIESGESRADFAKIQERVAGRYLRELEIRLDDLGYEFSGSQLRKKDEREQSKTAEADQSIGFSF